MYQIHQYSYNIHILTSIRNHFSRKTYISWQSLFLYLPFMSLFFSSNKMWFLVSYLPTFCDDVTLFTVFFLWRLPLLNIEYLLSNHFKRSHPLCLNQYHQAYCVFNSVVEHDIRFIRKTRHQVDGCNSDYLPTSGISGHG